MDLLEVPLDVLFHRLHSLHAAFAASVWTWLAVVAAAVGLWRIRAVGYKSNGSPLPSSPQLKSIPTQPELSVELAPVKPHKPKVDASKPVANVAPSSNLVEQVSTPKSRFRVYYDCSNIDNWNNDNNDYEGYIFQTIDNGNIIEDDTRISRLANGIELIRKVDLPWYQYQDMTMLNGSVVKLWDNRGGDRPKSRPSLRKVY